MNTAPPSGRLAAVMVPPCSCAWNTSNDAGEQCTADNPCEVGADGTVTVRKGGHYGRHTDVLVPCLTAGSRLDLIRPGCHLTPPAG